MGRYSGDSDLIVCDDDAGGYFTSMSLFAAPPAKAHAHKQKRRRHDRPRAATAQQGEEGAVGDGGRAAAGDKWALQLRFGLPPAAFATMLVREVSRESVHPALHCEKRRQAAKAVSLEARKPVTKPRSEGGSRPGSAPQPQAPRPGGEEDRGKMKGRENDDIHRGHRPRPSKKDFDAKGHSAGLRRRQQSTGHKRPQDVDQDTRGRSSSTSEPQRSASADVEETENTERAPGSRTKHKRRRSAEAAADSVEAVKAK